MVRSWRIVKGRHAASAFDGEGARVAGGRWSSPGTPMVYTSGSAALALLEMLVHLGKGTTLPTYVLISCTIDPAFVSPLDRSHLPRHWRSYPSLPELQQLGDEWVKGGQSAVLEVPSAIIDTESNYLLNPQHGDFVSIKMSTPRPLELDLRLARPG